MLEYVVRLLSKQLKKDEAEIHSDSKIKDDLGADSLDVMQILMIIEENYGIVFPDEKLAGFNTVGDIVKYLDGME